MDGTLRTVVAGVMTGGLIRGLQGTELRRRGCRDARAEPCLVVHSRASCHPQGRDHDRAHLHQLTLPQKRGTAAPKTGAVAVRGDEALRTSADSCVVLKLIARGTFGRLTAAARGDSYLTDSMVSPSYARQADSRYGVALPTPDRPDRPGQTARGGGCRHCEGGGCAAETVGRALRQYDNASVCHSMSMSESLRGAMGIGALRSCREVD